VVGGGCGACGWHAYHERTTGGRTT
jgi:hypothetical protein